MSGFQPRSHLGIATLIALVMGSPAFGQLSLQGSRGMGYKNSKRAERFAANQSIEATLRDRIQSRSILLGQLPWAKTVSDQTPLLFSREFGVAGNLRGPQDRAGRSSRSILAFNDYSQFANGIVNIPRPTDYMVSENLTWSVENVLESMKLEPSASRLFPPLSPVKTARESSIEDETNDYFEKGAAAFRAALSETNASDRATLMSNARHSFDLVNQLDIDSARGHLALAVVRFVQDDINTSQIHLLMGLHRSETLEQMDIGRTNFFPDNEMWQRRLDQLNIATRNSNNPRMLLLYAYWAFLNGDDVIALNAAEEAERVYKAIFDKGQEGDKTSVEGEEELSDTSRFRELLRSRIDAKAAAVSIAPESRLVDARE